MPWVDGDTQIRTDGKSALLIDAVVLLKHGSLASERKQNAVFNPDGDANPIGIGADW